MAADVRGAARQGALTPAEFATRLHARRSARGWLARCPAHDDRSPSLSIAEGDDGRILLHCFAGCSLESIVAALGLTMRDLFKGPRVPSKPKPPKVQAGEKAAAELRCSLTPRERRLPVTVVLASREGLDAAIARALALAVEGEIVQVALKKEDW
jgi:hypothetical protein